jgi:hypothetical protein
MVVARPDAALILEKATPSVGLLAIKRGATESFEGRLANGI